MNLTEHESSNINIKLYSNNDKQVELEIIERNNTFYIRSNQNIKLIENSNIKLVNEHYKPIEKNTNNEYKYDNSFFNNSIKKRNVIQDLFSNLKRSFASFIKPTKKIKMIYLSLALIGIMFAICAISISNATKVETSKINADDNYSTLTSFNPYLYN